MNQTPTPTISRLRKGGLTRTAAIAAVAATSALVTAQAGIVYGGPNIATVTPNQGVGINLDGTSPDEFVLQAGSFSKTGRTYSLLSPDSGFRFTAPTPTNPYPNRLAAGVTLDASGIYSDGSDAGFSVARVGNNLDPSVNWHPSESGYLGFTFDPTGSQALYGWVQFALSADNATMSLVDFAYDDSGASILTGQTALAAVPEPATTLFGLGLLGALGLRRRRAASTVVA